MKNNKQYIIFITCIIILCLLPGCNGKDMNNKNNISKNENSTIVYDKVSIEEKYEKFEKDYNKILENYKIDGFEELGWEYRGPAITFSEPSKIFKEENDMINGDPNKPVRKNIYYYNRKDKVLINITHIFINTSIGNHLLSSDYPRQEFEDIDIMVPIYNEHFMCYSNTLVSLKTIYTGKKKNFSIGNYYLNALKEYERVLEITQ